MCTVKREEGGEEWKGKRKENIENEYKKRKKIENQE